MNVVDVAEGIGGSAARYLGLLATTMRRSEDGEQHFEDALAMNASMLARPWLAKTQDDYARMLFVRNAPGDTPKAHRLRSQARTTREALSMQLALSEAGVSAR